MTRAPIGPVGPDTLGGRGRAHLLFPVVRTVAAAGLPSRSVVRMHDVCVCTTCQAPAYSSQPRADVVRWRADIVIQGLYELSKMWVDFSHDFRKDLQQCQVSAFFNGPVLSMAYGRNLGPDPLLESHPCPVDSGVTKNFAKVRRPRHSPACCRCLTRPFNAAVVPHFRGYPCVSRRTPALRVPQPPPLRMPAAVAALVLPRLPASTVDASMECRAGPTLYHGHRYDILPLPAQPVCLHPLSNQTTIGTPRSSEPCARLHRPHPACPAAI